ncbi:MAG: hypothetical protein AAF709_22095, partial [Pseudomonadota bacterium]
ARYRAIRKEIETHERSVTRRRITNQECNNDLRRLQHQTIRLDQIRDRLKSELVPEFQLSSSEASELGITARDYEVYEAMTAPTSALEQAWDAHGFAADFVRTIAESPKLSDVVRNAVGSSNPG